MNKIRIWEIVFKGIFFQCLRGAGPLNCKVTELAHKVALKQAYEMVMMHLLIYIKEKPKGLVITASCHYCFVIFQGLFNH